MSTDIEQRLALCHHNFFLAAYEVPRAYKWGRGHAPHVHGMTRQNSNWLRRCAKFKLQAPSKSNVAVQAVYVYTGRMDNSTNNIMETTIL